MNVERWSAATGTSFDDVLRHTPDRRALQRFPYAPDSTGVLRAAAALARRPTVPQRVIDRIVQHNTELGNLAGVAGAQRLSQANAVVVMTGQQPMLFGGPLLAIHKAMGAVLAARALEAECGRPVIPVYWVHSVDHDLAEANQVLVAGGGDWRQASLPLESHGQMLAEARLTEAACAAAEELAGHLGLGASPELLPVAGESLAHWSARCLLAALPANTGLVFADARDLMGEAASFWQQCLQHHEALSSALAAGFAAVESLGHVPQVAAREGLQIFCCDSVGRRVRVTALPELGFVDSDGRRIAGADFINLVVREPERLSPGVLLRPVVQQFLLPICAHVNGPAENAYFAQLPELFSALGQPLPVALPRPRLTWLTARAQRASEILALPWSVLRESPATWPRVAPQRAGAFADLDAATAQLMDQARVAAGAAQDAADVLQTHITNALEKFAKTVTRRQRESEDNQAAARHKLAMLLHPQGRPQERALGPWALLGPDARAQVTAAFAGFDPWDHRAALVRVGKDDKR